MWISFKPGVLTKRVESKNGAQISFKPRKMNLFQRLKLDVLTNVLCAQLWCPNFLQAKKNSKFQLSELGVLTNVSFLICGVHISCRLGLFTNVFMLIIAFLQHGLSCAHRRGLHRAGNFALKDVEMSGVIL